MTTWAQFEAEAAELAAIVRERFEAAETHILATLRKDGAPRVSGSEVAFKGEDLTFGSMLGAVKALDLRRDGRCAIHAHPSTGGDVKVAGVAMEVAGDAKNAHVPEGETLDSFHAFRLDLREAVYTVPEGDELVIRLWQPGQGLRVIRRK